MQKILQFKNCYLSVTLFCCRKSGFQAIQNKEQAKKSDDKNKNPWGPIFKDKKNFANLHNC